MLPELKIGSLSIPTFSLCAITGVTAFVLITLVRLSHYENSTREAYFIVPKIFIVFGIGFVGAVVFDALFKIPQNNGFRLSGITFYGGAVTGIAALAILISIFHKNSKLCLIDWLNFLTIPFLIFHFFGRIGCFLGGCCYGQVTDSIFGMYFPDNEAANIFHNGQKVYPTQLFEAIGIAIIAISLLFTKKYRFVIYCFTYPVLRFCIEFLRGDNRGSYFGPFSPAQIISLIIMFITIICLLYWFIKKRHKDNNLSFHDNLQ